MSIKKRKDAIAKLKASCKAISKERDNIRNIMEEYESALDCANTGLADLQYAINKLSEVF